MKIVNKMLLISSVLSVSAFFAAAQAAPTPVQLTSQVQELVQVVDQDGKTHLKAVKASAITPGDRILYTTTISNKGAESSDDIVVTNPIPAHSRYLSGTAKGEHCIITYSANGGKSWGKPESLKVRQKDGQLRAAQASDYTHIRWEYSRSLLPSEVKKISFQTQLL
jgi:uncharacterized repeat protein (TIGR01451 family)